jgi:hypothetical protein
LNWRKLNRELSTFTESEVLAMLNTERASHCRLAILERLHQRYCTLRNTRERLEILREAKE